MKKVLLAVLALLLIAGPVYAGQNVRTLIDDVLLTPDGDNKQVVSEATSIEGSKKVSFFVAADGTTDTVSCEVTVEISYDGVTWLQASFRDFAGGATLQTSESSMEGDYYMWLDTDYITAPYVRVSVGMMNPETILTDNMESMVSVKIVREQ